MKVINKSIFSSALVGAMLLSSFGFVIGRPDEGMYTPDQIAKLPLAERGLKIKPTDIYNPQGDVCPRNRESDLRFCDPCQIEV